MATLIGMKFTFDLKKDQLNLSKHGVSLEDAAKLDWDAALSEIDDRHEYGEIREIAYAPIEERLYCVVFTRHRSFVRIISLRKANKREFNYYVSKINTAD